MTSESETLNPELETRSSAGALAKEKQSPARILIVDDHAIVRYGMGVMLSGADDLTLCGEAENIDEALKAIRELKPDAAVIDIVLKNESGLELIRQIRAEEAKAQKSEDRTQPSPPKASPNHEESDSATPASLRPLPLLVMSMHNESTHAEKALRAGAQGYIMKENADEVLVDALRTILSGKLHVSKEVHEKMLRSYVTGDEEPQKPGIDSLTAREKEILEEVGNGLTSREIAEQFNLSPRTVEVHRANIKKKLECETAAQLLRMAVQWVESR
jgi:DNA-binding NarL/FixJ family response regulator